MWSNVLRPSQKFFPPIAGRAGFGQVTLNLYDPFGILPEQSAAEKERGLFVEVNNGRLAMLGLFSVLAESAVPGSNPQYKILDVTIPSYDGNVMGGLLPLDSPFVLDFAIVLGICGFLQQLKNGAVSKLPN